MATTGTATLDFGAFPGKSDASVDVTGQSAIVSGSLVEAWLRPEATPDHTADEHMVETLKVIAGNIQAGVGFTIYGFNTSELNEAPSGWLSSGQNRSGCGGRGTRIWGRWTVAWVWN